MMAKTPSGRARSSVAYTWREFDGGIINECLPDCKVMSAFRSCRLLVPRLCLGTHCLGGSASRGGASGTVRSQADPGNEIHSGRSRLAVIYVVLTIVGVIVVAVAALAPLFLLLYLGEHALNAAPFGRFARFLLVALKSLRRNLLRTTLTYLATFVLVVVIVMVWSVLHFLGELTSEKAKDLKIIVSEKYQMGS